MDNGKDRTGAKSLHTVNVVSHTHWDREWYQDFQGYRARLVYMMDELIDTMEKEPRYRYFFLDGQTIMVEDYLEIRPDRRDRLMALIVAGRIQVGPWYVMPDEFLVSGESLIRNLMRGFRMARAWGTEAVKSGYIPDVFGHNSQFPQILHGFGIDNAVLFRGFHGDGDPFEIIWEAADGSRVLGLKLDEDRSYSDFYFFFRWPFVDRDFQYESEELIARARTMLDYKQRRSITGVLLGLDGVDHGEIEPQLPWMLEQLNQAAELTGVRFEHTHLEDYLGKLRSAVSGSTSGLLPVFRGEQRKAGYNGVNNFVLANVLSSRIYLKQRNQQGEKLLEQWAEPWGVFAAIEGREYPQGFLDKAWEYLLQNHPHDSICGCSIDQVHRDMLYRFDQSRLIAERMIEEQLAFIAGHISADHIGGKLSIIVFNPSQVAERGVVTLDIPLPVGTDAAVTLPLLGGTSFRLFDDAGCEVPYQTIRLQRNATEKWRPYRDIPHGRQVDRFTVALMTDLPPCGYRTYTVQPYTIDMPKDGDYASSSWQAPVRSRGSMQVAANVWDNGRIRVTIRENGTFDLTDQQTGREFPSLLLFEDEADIGDGWKHIAPISNEVVRSAISAATLSVLCDGPMLTRIRICLRLTVPARIDADQTRRSEEKTEITIDTILELRKGDPLLRVTTTVGNTARDHRLRVLLPTGLGAEYYQTSTPFDLVSRLVSPPDYSTHLENDSGVAPHNGIIAVEDEGQGIAVYSKGLYEMAMREANHTIALTLFRSTRNEVLTDGGDGGQLLGDLVFEYAIRPFASHEASASERWMDLQRFNGGIRSAVRQPGRFMYETPHRRQSDLSASRSYLEVEGRLILSALKQAEDLKDAVIVRLFNPEDTETTGMLKFAQSIAAAQLVGLNEQPLEHIQDSSSIENGRVVLRVGPKRIVTLLLRFG
ncbi:alpha-mannosidase [Cohnella sp. 56]|uniref:alpha-mannosidase n=1 Tax=Cohnella sp. 56 TaxID=3113722 RepID=UPI0030E8C94B